jgi:Domain of unknown function (DUF4169)
MRGNMGEIVNLRHARKQRARIAATKDAAAKRAKSSRPRAQREATGRARRLEEKPLDARRREVAVDDKAVRFERSNKTRLSESGR